MKIILSTRNPSKAEQIKALFSDPSISILTLADAGVEGEAVEDGSSLKENALRKALFAHSADPTVWTMADDTGLFIKALDGVPGIYAARWAGENATTPEITQYCLKQLEGIQDREATFETVVALISPDGSEYFFTGEVKGKILEAPRVPAQPKMPYSPLFVPDGYDLSWAEMSTEQENAISHRGQAFRKVLAFLKQQPTS